MPPPHAPLRALRASLFALFAGLSGSADAAVFGFKDVDALAKQRAGASFNDAGSNLPSALKQLDHDRYQTIQPKPESALWRRTKSPFVLDLFAQGWAFDRPVGLHEITPAGVRDLVFNAQQFDYSKAGIDAPDSQGLGYAGLRAEGALNVPGYRDEFVSFLGASYYRALGKGQLYGISARGLAIDTAQASGEEFPRFVDFWVERPKPGAKQLVVYALLDSRRATGAYRFAIEPGVDTVVDVNARVYLRDKVDKLGIAPLTSMFFYGANQRGGGDDYRPEVHDSDGLSIQSAGGEWLWRPLVNPKRLLVTSFAQVNPKGFGLMQRARDFSRYEDLHTRYDLHPSAWVEPLGAWGAGRVELVTIPTSDETNDNIVAYWVPDNLPAPQQPLDLSYRVHWQKDAETRPPSARVAQTRRGKAPVGQNDPSIGFVIDYVGNLGSGDAAVTAEVETDANAQVIERSVQRNAAGDGWRLALRIHRGDENKPVELRAVLRRGDAVSETWSYALPPG